MAVETPFLSIIIPCFNSEKTLSKTLESIKNQTFRNYECILVENGSTDSTFEICKKICCSDHRFKLFRLNKPSLSNARNLGLSKARGSYIGWVDSDDFIHPDMFFQLVSSVILNNADISFCDVAEVRRNQIFKLLNFYSRHQILDEEAMACEIAKDFRFKSYLVNKIFRASLFNDFYFRGKILEDFMFFTTLLGRPLKVFYTPFTGYFYVYRSSSVSREITPNKLLDRLPPVLERLQKVINLYPQYGVHATKNFNFFIDRFLRLCKQKKEYFEYIKDPIFLSTIKQGNQYFCEYGHLSIKRRILYFLLEKGYFKLVYLYFYFLRRD